MTPLLLASVLSAAPGAAPARNVLQVEPAVAVVPATAQAPEVGIPFGCGLAFPVSQGHNVGSHLNHDTYAWDFRMPEGTPVVAAQDGVVRMARGDSTVGGCDMRFAPFANYVVVEHANGMETQYLHFSRVTVKAGQPVRRGELLGFSGETGWSCGAHLHFKVAQRRTEGWNNPSLPARLVGYGDPDRGTLIVAPSCNSTPDVLLTRAPAAPEGAAATGTVVASATQPAPQSGAQPVAQGGAQRPAQAPRGGKVAEMVEAVQDAAAAAATAVMPASRGQR